MALSSFDDKLLGEKVNYYVSSDEEDNENSDEEQNETEPQTKIIQEPKFIPTEEYNGKATYTGPKGVMEDWRRYKQLEVEKKQKDEKERLKLCKKLALTCRSNLDDEKADAQKNLDDDEDDTDFMEWYKQKRIAELQQQLTNKWAHVAFGKVLELKHANYVEAIEHEKSMVTVIIHIYEEGIEACRTVNGCLNILAEEYKYVKFCKITASEARVSTNFKHNALPAILAYKDNMLIGNYVRISDTLNEDFYATDLEQFLNEYGLLTGNFTSGNLKNANKSIITGPTIPDSDSD